jgi:hypothetical protein
MGTNCVPILIDFYFYSFETNFTQGLLKKHEKKLGRSFNFTFHYIGDVLLLIKFDEFVDHIYPIKVDIKGIPRYS